MVAWELTRNCNLNCVHCRARADMGPHQGELTTDECRKILDDIASFSSPTIILTGGEPLLRDDIFEIIQYGRAKGLRMVIAVNGTLLDRDAAQKLKDAGILRVSMSLDGKDAGDAMTTSGGVSGSFDAVMRAARALQRGGLALSDQHDRDPTQYRRPRHDIRSGQEDGGGGVACLPSRPVGRGEGLKGEELNATMYEDVLELALRTRKSATRWR